MQLRKKKTDWSVLRYLAYFTQFGVTMIVPPVLCAYGAFWLKGRFGLGNWVVVAGIVLGVVTAAAGVRDLLRMTENQARRRQQEEEEHK